MSDVHDKVTRSRNMAAIRGQNTKPEITLRRGLHRAGLRFRLHGELPGKPDIVFRRFEAVVFVHGCFWHMHGCPRFKMPRGENKDFWRRKLEANADRDKAVRAELTALGWRNLVVWECALVGKGRKSLEDVVAQVKSWLVSQAVSGEISGDFSKG